METKPIPKVEVRAKNRIIAKKNSSTKKRLKIIRFPNNGRILELTVLIGGSGLALLLNIAFYYFVHIN